MAEIVTVDFRGDTLFGFKEGDVTFVGMKPMVEAMGLQWSGQLQRIKRDPILSEGVCMIHTPFGRGGDQQAVCMRLDLVNGWLFTIDTSRIKDEAVRDKVLTYQRECYRVLHDHFVGKQQKQPVIEDEELAENEATRLRKITECRHIFGVRAAGELWFQLGMPITPSMLQDPRQLTIFDYSAIKSAEGQ